MSAPGLAVGWVAEPAHWSELRYGDVLELGPGLSMLADAGRHEGRAWLKVTSNGTTMDGIWAPDGVDDPLVMVLRRRDVLAGEVIG